MTVSLRAHNTLGVECEADALSQVTTLAELQRVVRGALERDTPLTVLGGGSNVILRRRIAGTVLLMGDQSCRIESDTRDAVRLWAGAGKRWHALTQETLNHGWSGLENLSLIPGTTGAAPIQNIGAYGVEVADRIERVDVIDRQTGELIGIPRDACDFGYRTSRFKLTSRYLVAGVVFRLDKKEQPEYSYPDVLNALQSRGIGEPRSRDVADVVMGIRQQKLPDPAVWGNVGSMFKNPVVPLALGDQLALRIEGLRRFAVSGSGVSQVKLAAAQLIDLAGWKGKEMHGVGVWPLQPLVLVNRGTTRGADFLDMASAIQTDVLNRFGVALELEPVVLGYD